MNDKEHNVWVEDIENAWKYQNEWIDKVSTWRNTIIEYLCKQNKMLNQSLAYLLCTHPYIIDGEYVINKEELEKFAYHTELLSKTLL